MEIHEQDVNKIVVLVGAAILLVLAFFIVRPILLSVIGGLLLAYIFMPIYNRLLRYTPYKSLAAGIVTFLVILIVLLPVWFLSPIMFQELFKTFLSLQGLDIRPFLETVLPTASDQFIVQLVATFQSFISKFTSNALNFLIDLLLNTPTYLIHSMVILFVAFFALRDSAKLREFASGISPLSKERESLLVKQFKDITESLIYGQVIVGVYQGVVAGIGFWIFGIPNAFVLTIFSIILGIIPVVGPVIVWVPLALYMLYTHSLLVTALFVIYNGVLVSTLDNILRSYIVSRRIDLSPAVVIVGLIGGTILFGVVGLVLGPLILTYLITFLKSFKEKEFKTLLAS